MSERTYEPRDIQALLLLSPERRRNHPLLKLCLKGLNDPYWPLALALNSLQLADRDAAVEYRLGEQRSASIWE